MLEFPTCDDEWLSGVVDSFRARSKAISYRTRGNGWTITREIEPGDSERLNIDLVYVDNDDTRLSIWSDRSMWLRVCRGTAKNGWDFILSFNGSAASISPTELVEQLIESFGGDESWILSIWKNVGPQIVRSETKA